MQLLASNISKCVTSYRQLQRCLQHDNCKSKCRTTARKITIIFAIILVTIYNLGRRENVNKDIKLVFGFCYLFIFN